MSFQRCGSQNPSQEVLEVIKSCLDGQATKYARFLTLIDRFFVANSIHDAEETVLHLAEVLKAYPSGLYQLNQFFYPHVRLEFNIQHSPVTSLVIKTPEASRIVLLDPRHRLHNLSTVELRDILVTRTFGDKIYDVIHGVTDPFLRDCLAQLAQDILDWPDASKTDRKVTLEFLRQCRGIPPSLLLYDLTFLDVLTFTPISDVYRGMLGPGWVIIKKPRIMKDSLDHVEIMQEVVACRQFCHPNVVGFLGIGSDETDQLYSFVTPYMKNGNVMEFLKHYPNANRLTLVWQVMKGLEFLHTLDPPIPHRAVKGTNILVDDDFICCLSDFGISSIPDQCQQSRDYAIGNLAWMAPEVLLPPETEPIDPLKVDIFALAITILEIFIGRPPLTDAGFSASYMARVTGKEELPLPPQCPYAFPEFLCELVEMMSSYEPRQRPTARLTCQGFEDNLIFPKEIDLQVAESEYPVETQIGYSYPSWTQEMTRQWITAEREQMGNFKTPDINFVTSRAYLFNARSSAQTMDMSLLRQASHNIPTFYHLSPISPLPDLSDFHGPPTPPPDPKPATASQVRLARSMTSGKRRGKSRSRTPPIHPFDPASSQSSLLRGSQRFSRKPAGISISSYPPPGSPGSCAFSNPFSSNLPSPQTPEPDRWSIADD